MLPARLLISIPAVTLMALLMACPATEPPTTTDGASGSGSTSDQGTAADDASTSNTGIDPSQSSSQGTGDSSMDSSGDGMAPGIEEACELNCAMGMRCFPENPPPASCVETCVDAATGNGLEGCEAATIERYLCLAGLTCEELLDGFRACADVVQQSADACNDGCVIGGGSENGECSYGFYCPELEQVMRCDAETCVCLENRVEVGSCEAMGICDADSQRLREYPEICCGFVPPR